MAANDRPQYIAALTGVEEVTLRGTVDLAYWRERLLPYGLTPLPTAGQAQLLVISAQSKYMGIRFREVSFSVVVTPEATSQFPDAAFLIQAFNSHRFFACCERWLFSTPYVYAACRIRSTPPVRVGVTIGPHEVFTASMGCSPTRQDVANAMDGWHGKVWLPASRVSRRPYFVAEIRGATAKIPFDPAQDEVTLGLADSHPIAEHLHASCFQGREWFVRRQAFHGKSRTRVLAAGPPR